MAKAQHRTREYIAAYRAIKRAQAAGQELWCNEVECVYRSRVIYPWQRAAVLHDQTGTRILGPGHHRCNAREAAIRGNKMRGRKRVRRLVL
jgi:hypothetical protein